MARDGDRYDENVVGDGESKVLPHQPGSGSRDAIACGTASRLLPGHDRRRFFRHPRPTKVPSRHAQRRAPGHRLARRLPSGRGVQRLPTGQTLDLVFGTTPWRCSVMFSAAATLSTSVRRSPEDLGCQSVGCQHLHCGLGTGPHLVVDCEPARRLSVARKPHICLFRIVEHSAGDPLLPSQSIDASVDTALDSIAWILRNSPTSTWAGCSALTARAAGCFESAASPVAAARFCESTGVIDDAGDTGCECPRLVEDHGIGLGEPLQRTAVLGRDAEVEQSAGGNDLDHRHCQTQAHGQVMMRTEIATVIDRCQSAVCSIQAAKVTSASRWTTGE